MGTHVLILTGAVIGLLICSLRDSRNIHGLRNDLYKLEAQVVRNEANLLRAIIDIKGKMPPENKTGQNDCGKEIPADGSRNEV